MSHRLPQRKITEFEFHQHGDIPDFDDRVARVKRVYDGMTDMAKEIIPAEHCSAVHIHAGAVPEDEHLGDHTAHARYTKRERKIDLPANPDLTNTPAFLHSLYSDFDFVAAHELQHPAVLKFSARTGHLDKKYQTARQATLAHIRSEHPEVQAKLDPILAALRECDEAEIPNKPNLRASIIAMAGIEDSRPAQEQAAFYMGLLLSDEFHCAFGYTMDVARMKPDTTYDEDLCNTRALAGKFGPDNVKAVAGELVRYIDEREGLYRQMLNTKTYFAEYRDTFTHMQLSEWRSIIHALEDEFPGGGPASAMGGASREVGQGRR